MQNVKTMYQGNQFCLTTTTTTVLRPFVRDYRGEPVPEETLTHPPSWSSSNFYQLFHLLQSTTSSLFKYTAIFLHNLSPRPLWSTSWSGPLHSYSVQFFTQSVSSFRNTCPYYRNLFWCSTKIISSIPSLPLNSLLGTLSFTLTSHTHLTILISARWSATSLWSPYGIGQAIIFSSCHLFFFFFFLFLA